MTGYDFTATCPRDGGLLTHVTGGQHAGTESRAVAKCCECGQRWLVCVTLRAASNAA